MLEIRLVLIPQCKITYNTVKSKNVLKKTLSISH